MNSVSRIKFDFAVEDGRTEVNWSISGSLPFVLFWITANIETFVRMDSNGGFKMPREWSETDGSKSQTSSIGPQAIEPFSVLGTGGQCEMKNKGGHPCSRAQGVPLSCCSELALTLAAKRFRITTTLISKKFMITPSAVSCTEARTSVPQGVNAWSLPTVQAFHIDHLGAYE